MSDNDSVNRGEVRREIAKFIFYNKALVDEWAANCIDDIVDDIPAVPQEMTVSEFARARNRMCLFHLPFCNGCTVLPERKEFGEVIHDCPLWTLRDPDKAVAIVEAWEREHPEERSEE